MFDVIMIAVFTVAIVGVIFFAFKPVLDTILILSFSTLY